MKEKRTESRIFVIRISKALKDDITGYKDARHLNFSSWFNEVITNNMRAVGLLGSSLQPRQLELTPKDEGDRRYSLRNSGQDASQGIYINKVLLDTLRAYADSKECSAANVSELLRLWLEAEMKKHVTTKPVNRFGRRRQIEAA